MRIKILVVDDIQDNIDLVSEILSDFPVEIHEANSGPKAIELVETLAFGLIIMDVMMPKMSGFECTEIIRAKKQHSHIPIIFLTALGYDDLHVIRGYETGAIDYMVKPVNETILRSKVNIFIELEQRRQDALFDLSVLRDSQRNHEKILNFIGDGVLGLDKDNHITFANSAASMLLTTPQDKLIGESIKTYISPDEEKRQWQQSEFVQTFKEGQCNHCDDTFFWREQQLKFPVQYTQSSILSKGDVVGGVLVFQDISERKELENKLVNLAKFDQLTGLANRTLYWEFLQKNIDISSRKGQHIYCLLLDLDNFKEVNDTFGHDAGDILLIQASERISSTLRSADLVCRLGGDEFAVLLHDIDSTEAIVGVTEKLIRAFEPPFTIYEQQAYIGCSIGIANYPADGQDAGELTKSADTAMYAAKKSGKNQFSFFQKEMQERVEEHIHIANELRVALNNNNIIPYFQLKTDISTGLPVGAEALARWIHPEKGIISPASFIPVAEETGLIDPLGQSILIQAGKQTQEIRTLVDNSDFRTSINVSAKQIRMHNFASDMLKLFEANLIDPNHIELELTESCLLSNSQQLIKELNVLRKEGLHISIDDFGTGYSSLSYLKRIPLDTLKIDQCFVRDIGQDTGNENIIKAIIQLAHSLELHVTAEGVETTEQLDFLNTLSCDQAQGYLFGRPQIAEEFLFSLKKQKS